MLLYLSPKLSKWRRVPLQSRIPHLLPRLAARGHTVKFWPADSPFPAAPRVTMDDPYL